ncbi:MAG: hypothetical protein C4325_13510 [Blastocatellia bacterium]
MPSAYERLRLVCSTVKEVEILVAFLASSEILSSMKGFWMYFPISADESRTMSMRPIFSRLRSKIRINAALPCAIRPIR